MVEEIITFVSDEEKYNIPFVDEWMMREEDEIIRFEAKDILIIPVSKMFYGIEQSILDFFVLKKKRCYKDDKFRVHIAIYLNYFEKFFDTDHELISAYAMIKYMIHTEKHYTEDNLMRDVKKYILSPSLRYKFRMMNRYNYSLNLNNYKGKKESSLQYNNTHGMSLMELSLLFNSIIPIIIHYAYAKDIEEIDEFILGYYDYILSLYSIDIYSKLYDTSNTNIDRNKKGNSLWESQDIRGINVTTHTIESTDTLLLNIIPKYVYNNNVIKFNFGAINNTIGYKVLDIGYEFDYRSLSSSERDVDNNSVFDKYEAYLTKENEALYLQNKVNFQESMKTIENLFGPFSREEIDWYAKELYDGNDFIINDFQRENLIFNLFYKYFGDPESMKMINREDYIKLMIAAKRILQSANMILLPYIFSAKVIKIVRRKNLNKKELTKLKLSSYYPALVEKYNNPKIEEMFSEIAATILSSEFQIIDFQNQEGLDGKIINTLELPEMVVEEVLLFISLV